MEYVLPVVIMLLFGGGFLYIKFVAIPEYKRKKAAVYLDILGDDAAHDVQTGTGHRRRNANRRNEAPAEYAYARGRLPQEWNGFWAWLGGPRGGMDSVAFEDPREVHPLHCVATDWQRAHLEESAELRRALRSFLGGEGTRVINGEQVVYETFEDMDAMGTAAMASDVASVTGLLGDLQPTQNDSGAQ